MNNSYEDTLIYLDKIDTTLTNTLDIPRIPAFEREFEEVYELMFDEYSILINVTIDIMSDETLLRICSHKAVVKLTDTL